MTSEQFHRPDLGGFENKIVSYSHAIGIIKETRTRGLSVTLAQGVFDLVHVGHLEYLRRAKLTGDLLFVGVENDLCVQKNKGNGRPFNSLDTRLEFLSQLQSPDFVFGFDNSPLYSDLESREIFIRRYRELNPNLIAVTTNFDSNIDLKKKQAEEAGVELHQINIDGTTNSSTTRLLRVLGFE